MGACSAVVACADSAEPAEPAPDTETPGLIVTGKTTTRIEGTFNQAGMPLSFRSIETAPRSVEVTIRVGDTRLAMHTDYSLGEVSFDARSGQLSPAQIGALQALIAALAEVYGGEELEPSNAEVALRRSINYMVAAPPSTPLPTFKRVAETGWVHIQCSPCAWQYIGSGWYAWAGKGEQCGSSAAPHCPGRCGVGCGPDNLKWPWSWGSGVYTQDCALHDYGLGSWTNAADDYSLAPYNCG